MEKLFYRMLRRWMERNLKREIPRERHVGSRNCPRSQDVCLCLDAASSQALLHSFFFLFCTVNSLLFIFASNKSWGGGLGAHKAISNLDAKRVTKGAISRRILQVSC